MRVPRVRLCLVGVVCMACGVAGRVAFSVWAKPGSRLEAFEQALFLAAWFGIGLLLWAIPLLRRSYAPGELGRGEVMGWLFWAAGAAAACVAVVSSLGS